MVPVVDVKDHQTQMVIVQQWLHKSHGLLSSEASKVADQPLRKLHSLK